jgi:hypothetical protein
MIGSKGAPAGAIEAWPGKVALFERGWDTILPAQKDWIETEREEIDHGQSTGFRNEGRSMAAQDAAGHE